MNKNTLLIAAAALAAYFFATKFAGGAKPATKATGTGAVGSTGATLIQEWNGWKYYTDGTAIDPFGAYYLNGQKVWDPIMGAV